MRQVQTILLLGVLGWIMAQSLWGAFTAMALADPTGKVATGAQRYDEVAARYLAVRDRLPPVEAMGYLNQQPNRLRAATDAFGLARWALAPIKLAAGPGQHAYVLGEFPDGPRLDAALSRHRLELVERLSPRLVLLRHVEP